MALSWFFQMITQAHIRERLNQRPFDPFWIVMSSGQKYDVRHPEWIIVGKQVVGIGMANAEADSEFERIHTISVLHITALESIARTETNNNSPSNN